MVTLGAGIYVRYLTREARVPGLDQVSRVKKVIPSAQGCGRRLPPHILAKHAGQHQTPKFIFKQSRTGASQEELGNVQFANSRNPSP